jgi:hypothetical protein
MISRKRYKQTRSFESMQKRGQVAIFVIVAVVIIAAVIWFLVRPNLTVFTNEVDPSSYVRQCIEPELKKALPIIMEHGGDYTPTSYVLNNDLQFSYLCYTSENYKPCLVQQPLLVSHVEKQLEQRLTQTARNCIQSLQQNYEQKGYQVTVAQPSVNVSIVPEAVIVDVNAAMTISKDSKQTFSKFVVRLPSQSYDLLTTALSIVQFESTLGDSDTSLYVRYYPNLVIEKLKKGDDTLYTLRNVISQEKFRFATRSLVWPQGYGVLS